MKTHFVSQMDEHISSKGTPMLSQAFHEACLYHTNALAESSSANIPDAETSLYAAGGFIIG